MEDGYSNKRVGHLLGIKVTLLVIREIITCKKAVEKLGQDKAVRKTNRSCSNRR